MTDIPKTRLGVFAVEDPTLGTAVVAGYDTTVAIIGKTFGQVATLSDEAVARNASPNLTDVLLHNTINQISKVADIQGGVANYTRDVDYRLVSADSIEWLNTKVPAPTGFSALAQNVATPSHPGGLTAGVYDYVITAIRQITATPTVTFGETVVATLTASVTVGGGSPATNSVRLTWVPSVGGQGYRIYRKLHTDPDFTNALITEVPGGASNYLIDDGYAEGTGTPPVSNTATNRPADGATYYATYVAVLFNYFNPKTYFSLTELINDHSLGSDLAIGGSLILGTTGVGQGASKVMCVAVPDATEGSFLTALTALTNEVVNIVVPLVGDPAIQLDVTEHCLAMSDPITAKHRIAIFGNAKGTPIGDPNTSGTTMWAARRLELEDNDSNPQGQLVAYVGESSMFYNVQLPNGVYVETELDGWFNAAAVAGRIASLPDPAYPVTYKQLQGIISLGQNFTPNERDYLDSNGVLTLFDTNGIIKVYHGRTIDLLTVEHGEISIVRTKFTLEERLATRFANFIGSKITAEFLNSIVTGTIQELGIALKDDLIADYDKNTVSATQETGLGADPRRIDVTFKATPIYPANQIVFKFGFNL